MHGWGQDKSSMARLVETCSFSSYAIDLVPDSLPYSYDIYDYATRVFVFLKSLEAKKFVLVGHSFGGRIALLLSSIFDLDIIKLVLIDSAGIVPHSVYKWLKVKIYKLQKRLHIKHTIKGSSDYQKLDTVKKSSFVKIVSEDLLYVTPKINCTCDIIWGDRDIDTPMYMAKKFHKNILGSTLHIIQGGHFAYWHHIYRVKNIIEGGLC